MKNIYFFGDGNAEGNGKQNDLLGGKGANLSEMTNLGIRSSGLVKEGRREVMKNYLRVPDFLEQHGKFWNDYARLIKLAIYDFGINPIDINFFLVYEFYLTEVLSC